MRRTARDNRVRLGLLLVLGAVLLLVPLAQAGSPTTQTGRIAFARRDSANPTGNIFTMKPDGTGVTQLTQTAGDPLVQTLWPYFSPDGSKIVYDTGHEPLRQVWVMNSDGGNKTQLTPGPAFNGAASWSPDGTRLAFASNTNQPGKANCQPCINRIFVMNADGSGVTQVTDDTDPAATHFWPEWIGNNRIMFNRILFSGEGKYALWAVDIDGTHLRQLTPDSLYAAEGSASPDGKTIAFVNNFCGVCDLSQVYTMNIDGTNIRQIQNDNGNSVWPSWSPDGKQIVFASRQPPNFASSNIYIMDANGSNETQITNDPAGNFFHPSWGCPLGTCKK